MSIDVRNMGMMKLIVQAKYIGDETVVTKLKGTKEYKLVRGIKIYGSSQQEIKCEKDCAFLVDSTGIITMISDSTELVVEIHPEDLMYDIQDGLEENK